MQIMSLPSNTRLYPGQYTILAGNNKQKDRGTKSQHGVKNPHHRGLYVKLNDRDPQYWDSHDRGSPEDVNDIIQLYLGAAAPTSLNNAILPCVCCQDINQANAEQRIQRNISWRKAPKSPRELDSQQAWLPVDRNVGFYRSETPDLTTHDFEGTDLEEAHDGSSNNLEDHINDKGSQLKALSGNHQPEHIYLSYPESSRQYFYMEDPNRLQRPTTRTTGSVLDANAKYRESMSKLSKTIDRFK